MPIYEFLCLDCGKVSEVLMTGADDGPVCQDCSSTRLKKLISAQSSYSGVSNRGLPGTGDTACCGSSPSLAGCAGPGSCCGKAIH